MDIINMEVNISAPFNDKPEYWGLRGDPYLWEEMCLDSRDVKLLENEIQMEEYFYRLFYKLIGYEITMDKNIYVKRYSHGGMSSGYISPNWWTKIGIPLLLDRYKKDLD
jgi:hypothetical protein